MKFSRPAVIGVDCTTARSGTSDLSIILRNYGNNTGNLVFSEGLYRTVKRAKRLRYHFSMEDVADCDVIVVAAANWLNPYNDFGWLVKLLEGADKPIVLVGIGAQSDVDKKVPVLLPGTLRLLELAAERSAYISVRGEFSADVLEHYGLYNVTVTGCPSLLLCGESGPNIRETGEIEYRRGTIHATRHLNDDCSEKQKFLYHEAASHGADILLQSEVVDMYMTNACAAFRRQLDDTVAAKILERSYGETFEYTATYLSSGGKVFFDFESWVEYCRGRQFIVGTRIHGTVMSMIAGTPAVLLTHDSRTIEMAETMGIPTMPLASVDTGAALDIKEMLGGISPGRISRKYRGYRDNFFRFFADNGIAMNEPA